MNVPEVLSRCLSFALQHGASEAETFAARDDYFGNTIENSEVSLGASRYRIGIGLRLLVRSSEGSRIGFAFTEDFSEDGLRSVVRNALGVSATRIAESSEYSFPQGLEKSWKSFADPALSRLKPLDTADLAARIVAVKDRDRGIDSILGLVRMGITTKWIMNTSGVEGSYESSMFAVEVHATSGKKRAVGVDTVFSPRYDPTLAEKCAESAMNWARLKGGARAMGFRGRIPLILLPRAVTQLLLGGLLHELRGESRRSAPSLLSEGSLKYGSALTLKDRPGLTPGIGSRLFDDEGTEAKETIMIMKGEINTLMQNSVTAARNSSENTGFAFRGDYSGEEASYKLEPITGPSNVIVETEGLGSIEDMKRDLRRGIIIREVLPLGQGYAGQISASFRDGILFEADGSTRSIQRGTLNESFRTLVSCVSGGGSEIHTELFPGYLVASPSIITPPIVITSANVTA